MQTENPDGGSRTHIPAIKNRVLRQLSYVWEGNWIFREIRNSDGRTRTFSLAINNRLRFLYATSENKLSRQDSNLQLSESKSDVPPIAPRLKISPQSSYHSESDGYYAVITKKPRRDSNPRKSV